jgi:small nuclear ribonucleoprotein (snRNP)-like protein
MKTNLTNTNVTIILRTGFRYKGLVQEQDTTTLKIHDEKIDKTVIITLQDICAIEVNE